MASGGRGGKAPSVDPATAAFREGCALVQQHPVFHPLILRAGILRAEDRAYPSHGWANVDSNGTILCHPKRRGTAEEWAYVIGHCLLHLAFGHFQDKPRPELWNLVCDAFVNRFLQDLKFGQAPSDMLHHTLVRPTANEEQLYERFAAEGLPEELRDLGTAGDNIRDMVILPAREIRRQFGGPHESWEEMFARGLQRAVSNAVGMAAGSVASLNAEAHADSPAQRARKWFIDSYPFLGGVAAAFRILDSLDLCRAHDIEIAAVNREAQEIYINPLASLSYDECVFVIAHEILHAALRDDVRCNGRDFYLWNVACDYRINGWLIEMGVGTAPASVLHDPAFKGLSAETIYDVICTDLRRARKLMTLRGRGGGDMIGGPEGGTLTNLDDFVRSALMRGLEYHAAESRGLLPAGLIEEIRSLAQPPVPWEVQLGRWFDERFQPLENDRTYRRLSRRQEATPDIPRPRYMPDWEAMEGRTFGAVIDTSGSMPRALLARALGTVASYAYAKEVNLIRTVFCDAAAYDQGYMNAATLAHRVRVKGRGGTVLQPGIDLLQQAKDFPKEAPIMIITDGACDAISVSRDHAIICPAWAKLPFVPRGPVFRMPWKKDVPG